MRLSTLIALVAALLLATPVRAADPDPVPATADAPAETAPAAPPATSGPPAPPVPAAPPARGTPARAAAVAPPVTPAQASDLLGVLNDPQRRAQFTATLQAMLRTLPATAAATSTAAAPTAAVPLRPDSLGAALITQGSSWAALLAVQAVAMGRAIGDFPLFWVWVRHMTQDPDARARVLDATGVLVAVLVVALGLEALARLGLRRPLVGLAGLTPVEADEAQAEEAQADPPLDLHAPANHAPGIHAPDTGAPDVEASDTRASGVEAPGTGAVEPALARGPGLPEPPALEAEQRQVRQQARRHRTLRLLRRLPFALLRLVLELVPVGVFLLAALLMLATGLGAVDLTRDVVMVNVEAWVAMRVAMTVARTLVSPGEPRLRLLHVSDDAAAYLVAWLRRLLVVAVFGNAALEVGLMFGLYREAHDALLKLVALVVHLMLAVVVLQCRAPVAARLRAGKRRHGVLARLLNRMAAVWHWIAIFYIMALWVVWATELRNGYSRLLNFFVLTLCVGIVARLLGIVVLGGLDRAVHISPELASRYPGLEARAGRYYPVARTTLTIVLAALTAVALLEVWGFDSLGWLAGSQLGPRVVSAALTILVAGALAIGIWEGVNTAADRQLDRLGRGADLVRAARLRTLLPILRTALFIALAVVLGLTVLSQVGVNIAPLLAGAGIVGVAIGFGSQKLVQDFITGIFLLLENAMQVGDTVTVAGLSGTVETLSIRTIRLRAGDGSVHIIPFSSVTTVNNANRDFANADVTVGVAYREDTDRVGEVLADIVTGMRADPAFAERITGDLNLWGVDALGDFAVTMRGQIRTTAGGRWAVQREFNRRMKKRFEAEGIDIPFPVRTLLTPDLAVPPLASGGRAAHPLGEEATGG